MFLAILARYIKGSRTPQLLQLAWLRARATPDQLWALRAHRENPQECVTHAITHEKDRRDQEHRLAPQCGPTAPPHPRKPTDVTRSRLRL